jgi:hypothetical protein
VFGDLTGGKTAASGKEKGKRPATFNTASRPTIFSSFIHAVVEIQFLARLQNTSETIEHRYVVQISTLRWLRRVLQQYRHSASHG